ncbi:MAG TPA: 2-hydroxychromene-2-carboxylate isomerase [Burkholderiales bacterium]|jgi:2-hydroxychromene-2-carboxylate isomerase|nr:2-hydroxychromene-2-carboxylate isomerase [Burkholderiales bacterium]
MSAAPLEFWFEFASTYSYPAAMRIETLAGRAGVAIAWRPFLLGPIFQAQGWNDSPFNLYPAKGRYMWRDLERLCGKHGLPYARPAIFPQRSVLAARIALAAIDEPWLPALVRGIYVANFAEGADISTPGTLARVLAALGQDPKPWLDRAQAQPAKDALRANTARAQALGIFGAPTFVARGEVFWGGDRLEDALAWQLRAG